MITGGGPEGGSSGEPNDYADWEAIALWGDAAGHDLTPKVPEPVALTLIQRLLKDQKRTDPAAFVEQLLQAIDFEERAPGLIVGHDPIGLVRMLPDGRLERYLEKLLLERRKRNRNESASFGTALLLGERAVVYAMHFDHMGGSLGVVAGENFQRAADLATKEDLPFIGEYSSGGVRQQENYAGLGQMERLVDAMRKHKDKTNKPNIAVVASSWGGVSASAVPNADLILGMAGTDYGFSGPRVIETFEGTEVPAGAQTVENNLLDRNLDVIIKDTDELVDYVASFLKSSKSPDKKQLKSDNLPTLRWLNSPGQGRTIDFGPDGIAPAIYSKQSAVESFEITPPPEIDESLPPGEQLMKLYESFIRSPSRLDTEFVIRNAFSDAVPLYNHYIDMDKKVYPAIIAAVGKIGPQPFLIVGNQPSYRKAHGGKIQKIPATPGPEDFDYVQRMLEMGERLKLPLIFLTDTLGAGPTVASEKRGQSRAIAKTILAGNRYNQPVLSVVLSALGSGGGLATTPRGDYRAMLEHSMAFVAEPRSATSILYRKASPETSETMLTLSTMSAMAADQFKLGLIDEVIPESEDPYQTVANLHDALAKAYAAIQDQHFRRHRRSQRIRKLKGIPMRQLKK